MHDILTGATYALPVCGQGGGIAFPQLTADGRHMAFVSDATNLVPNDTNKATDVFVYDQGSTLAVDDMVSATAKGGGGAMPGLRLLGASVVSRPRSHDLFVRIDVADMPRFDLANPAVVYAVDFAVGSQRYELRAGKVGASASFGLFRATPGGWMQAATLHGGYGTTGQSVVATVPLADPTSERSLRATDVVAFSGLGDFRAGAAAVVQRLPLGALA